MSDIYHIPGDNGKDFRLKKFVEYQHEVPSIHYRFLGEWIKKNSFSKDEAVDMFFLMSSTYNEITCVLLRELFKKNDIDELWAKYKSVLEFGSARKYAKNCDWWPQLMKDWRVISGGDPYRWIKSLETNDPEMTYRAIQAQLSKISHVGRFASDLFMEMAVYLSDYIDLAVKEPLEIDWKNCANLTSGIFNIFYEDEKANKFDAEKKVSKEDRLYLSKKLKIIQGEIQKTYPEQNAEISMFIGKICSFRNLFKNARYGGFHHDRELGWIIEYQRTFPEYKQLWDECFQLRRQIFPEHLLGELHGWGGIRKERKKIWLSTGRTGVEK